jgi:hypothetical protein
MPTHGGSWLAWTGRAKPCGRLLGALPPARSSSSRNCAKARETFTVRDAGVSSAQLRTLLELSPGARQAVADLIEHTARAESRRRPPDRD